MVVVRGCATILVAILECPAEFPEYSFNKICVNEFTKDSCSNNYEVTVLCVFVDTNDIQVHRVQVGLLHVIENHVLFTALDGHYTH